MQDASHWLGVTILNSILLTPSPAQPGPAIEIKASLVFRAIALVIAFYPTQGFRAVLNSGKGPHIMQ